MIKINGLVFVDGKEFFFEDFQIDTNDELDLPFDDDEEDDYDREFWGEEDEEEESVDEIVDDLTSIYADILSEGCFRPECLKSIIIDYTKDLIDSL